MRIFKEGIKRLPPQCIEKWAVLTSFENFFPSYVGTEKEKILSTHDATWDGVVGVHESFLKGFLSGSPIGISCDLTRLSESLLQTLSDHIAAFKIEREFWENAVCHILADTEKILVFSYKTMQNNLTVYPKVDACQTYLIENEVVSGKDISENGVELSVSGNYRVTFSEITRVK